MYLSKRRYQDDETLGRGGKLGLFGGGKTHHRNLWNGFFFSNGIRNIRASWDRTRSWKSHRNRTTCDKIWWVTHGPTRALFAAVRNVRNALAIAIARPVDTDEKITFLLNRQRRRSNWSDNILRYCQSFHNKLKVFKVLRYSFNLSRN